MSWTSIFKGLQGGTGAGQRIFGGGGENSLLRKPVVDALGTNNRVNLTIHPLEFSIYTGASLEVCGGTNGEGLAPFHPPTSGQLKKYVKYVEWLNRVRITLPSSVDVSLARIHAPWNNDSFSVAEKQMLSAWLCVHDLTYANHQGILASRHSTLRCLGELGGPTQAAVFRNACAGLATYYLDVAATPGLAVDCPDALRLSAVINEHAIRDKLSTDTDKRLIALILGAGGIIEAHEVGQTLGAQLNLTLRLMRHVTE